jgi:hypothetical protein
MFRKGRKQVGMLMLAALLLGSAPAAAADGQDNGSFLSWAWQWVQSIWADEGACIDPNGCSESSHPDRGACIDPDGAPCAAPTADEGPHIDPDG